MSDNVKRGSVQRVAAVLAAGAVGFGIALLSTFPYTTMIDVLHATDGGMYGLLLGMVGVSDRYSARAGIAGAVLGGIPGLILVLIDIVDGFSVGAGRVLSEHIGVIIWIWVAGCSFGSICAQVGAIMGGPLTVRQESTIVRRFPSKRLIAIVIPSMILLLGFLMSLMR